MKKLLSFIVFSFLVFVLSGCTVPFLNQEPRKVTLKYWGLWEPEQVMQTVINDYEKLHPNVTVEYKKMSPQRYRETVTARLAEGVGPDLFRFHNTWLAMLKNELAIVPVKVMDPAVIEKTFYPIVKKDLKLGGQYYGMPLEIDSLALFINSDILKAAGATPPTTWEEFKTLAQKLTVKDAQGKIQTAGAALGTTNNIQHWSDILGLMMLQNGVDMTKIDSTVLADGSNAGVDALDYFASFAKGDNKVWDETLDDSMLSFAQGKLAMFFGPHWETFEIKATNQSLNFVTVAVPQLSGGNTNWATYWVEGVARRSKNQEEAFAFLKYLVQSETLKKFYTDAGKVRLYGEPYSRVDMANLIKDDPLAGIFVKQTDSLTSWYLSSRTFDNGINDKIIQYLADAVNGVHKETTSAKSALTTAASGVNTILTQYGLKSQAGVPKP
ncbi:extracellular solute-binding protein [Candidatus Gottesmanbacteria bacterium]|nr:extracellular solute-binding protein [Candidatus Gottesmanbacteria bacterium]